MLESAPLLAVTIGFISVFIYLYANLQLADIRANWNIRRCEPLVMIMAQMIPTDRNINKSEFASENFSFCINRFIDQSMSIFLAPMMSIFSEQLSSADLIGNSMNYLKGAAASLMKPFSDLFGFLWKKLSFVIYEAARIFMKINSSFKRIFGIAVSSLFAGISAYRGIQNAIKFVLQVCVTILTILVVLVVFLFFVMIPVIPLILTMIGILSTTIYAGNVSGMGPSFCVAPGTMVATKDGWRAVETLLPGDALDYGTIEGILVADGKGAYVSISGTILSGNHLVFNNGWIPANEHPLAQAVKEGPAVVYCLNTSKNTWRVKCEDGSLLLRDWEELPAECSVAWESYVYDVLNGGIRKPVPVIEGRGLLGANTFVYSKNRGPIRIYEVDIGDYVKDSISFTKVIGIYRDTSELQPGSGPNPAVWSWSSHQNIWTHPYSTLPANSTTGYHIVTESGMFFIGIFDKTPMLIRDFTEVGWDQVDGGAGCRKGSRTVKF